MITGADVQQLTDILAGKALGADDRIGKGRPRVIRRHPAPW